MKRRNLIILLGGAVLGWPRAARTQQSAVPRVGYVWAGARGTEGSGTRGLRRGFADLGYVVGRNLLLEERYANGNPERVASLIDELLALNVNVLVTPGTPITLAAHRATSTVPIVSVTGDPVRTGLAESLARPGGNVTGLSLLSGDYSVKWLELLREAAPARRVASHCCCGTRQLLDLQPKQTYPRTGSRAWFRVNGALDAAAGCRGQLGRTCASELRRLCRY